MPLRRSFKSDVSFLEKISMGAIGTRKVFDNLMAQGHKPIELERGSMSFKIWKEIKIKRIRVSDILCIKCGRRVESRAKTKPEITMSHSLSDPERGWDFGLDEDDIVAIVICKRVGESPIDWGTEDFIQYLKVGDMREAFQEGQIIQVSPKGVQEGFESRITWPAAIVKSYGTIISITERLQYKRDTDNRTITLQLKRNGIDLSPLVSEGGKVLPNQIIASTIPVVCEFPCTESVPVNFFLEKLTSPSLTTRYTSVKALSYFKSPEVVEGLEQRIDEIDEHIYVKLEAAASLARQNEKTGWEFIRKCIGNDYLQNRLETIIILGEIESQTSHQLLSEVLLDEGQHAEIRAGAAWALGELKNQDSIDKLIESFSSVDDVIKFEAARSLRKLADKYTPEIITKLSSSSVEKRPGIAWALGKAEKFSIADLIDLRTDEDMRHWISYIIGTQNNQKYVEEIELLKEADSEVYFAVTLLWKIMSSWIYNLEEF